MPRKDTYYFVLFFLSIVILSLPNSVVNFLYYHLYLQSSFLLTAVKLGLPVVVVGLALLFRVSWIKAIIAGVISSFGSLFILGIASLTFLDCGADVTASYGLSQACDGSASIGLKIGLAAILCFNMFLLERMVTAEKRPKS